MTEEELKSLIVKFYVDIFSNYHIAFKDVPNLEVAEEKKIYTEDEILAELEAQQ